MEAYHSENVILRENKCMDECERQGNRFTFSGVNAHHTNGITEIMIG